MPKWAESGISIRLLCVSSTTKVAEWQSGRVAGEAEAEAEAGAENVNRAKWRSNYLNG